MNPLSATPTSPISHARERRARLIERLIQSKLDAAIITNPTDIAYFTASQPGVPAAIPACLLVRTSGESILVCGESPTEHHVDRVFAYRWHAGGTISTELIATLIEHAVPRFRYIGACIGVQHESISAQLMSNLEFGAFAPIDRAVLDLQRTKDALDLLRIRESIKANLAAFEFAAKAIACGANELEVFAAASRGAMLAAGEKVVHDGDYQCGAPSGPCRNRAIRRGELYLIDAWTQRAGYWSDLARVFPVGSASDEQAGLIQHVQSVHEDIREMLRPGTSGDEIWAAMDAALRKHSRLASSGLVHHGGHGIGQRIHEPPDINPGVTDTLRAGDVICIEPGAYTPVGNVRLEEMYLITANGAVCLSEGARS